MPRYKKFLEGEEFEVGKQDCCTLDITKEQLKEIAIHATNTNIEKHLNGINLTFKDCLINTCLRRIHFLAQIIHESGSFRYTKEVGVSNSEYGGFKGRGLLQITFEENYKSYGEFANEDVTSSLVNKQKLEKDPHAAKSAGWYWSEKAKLNNEADFNDFIMINRLINGGFNGYNDRLKYVKKGFEVLYKECEKKKDTVNTDYSFKDSKAYNDKRASFAWGLWHDPDLNKSGCTKDKQKAIDGYKRFLEITTENYSSTNWYGIKNISSFSNLVYYDVKQRKRVKVRKAAEQRLKALEE